MLVCAEGDLLARGDERDARFQGMLLHALGHEDEGERTRALLTIPVVVQGVRYILGHLVAGVQANPSVARLLARTGVNGGAAAVSVLTMLLYRRYQEIYADNNVKYKSEQARAYAKYLKEKQQEVDGSRLYRTNPVLYEVLSTTPLYSKRARWLERSADKVERARAEGKRVEQKIMPTFLPAICALMAKRMEAMTRFHHEVGAPPF